MAEHITDRQLAVSRAEDGGDALSRMYSLFSAMDRASILPSHLKGPADAAICAAYGAALGMDPMTAIYRLHFIEGRPSLSADAMAGLVKASPACVYLMLVSEESGPSQAVYETHRRGDPRPTRMGFTMDEARAAGLAGRGNWSKYPAAMLRARAVTAICRAVYPDVCGGMYDPDELRDIAPPDVITVQAVHAPPRVEREQSIAPEPRAAARPTPRPLPYLSDDERNLLDRLDPTDVDSLPSDTLVAEVRSESTPGATWLCHRFGDGSGRWHCTCPHGTHTADEEHSACHHTARAELRLASLLMGPRWETIALHSGGDWESIHKGRLDEAGDMWRAWRAAQ